MTEPRLTLFGMAGLEPSDPAEGRLTGKALALLAYLALEPGGHRREALASLLWGESDDGSARASLRQALRQLREALGPAIAADRDSISLAGPIPSDVSAFLEAVSSDTRRAVEFDVPRFLEGMVLRGAPAFDEWRDATRVRLIRRYQEALRIEARDALGRSRWRRAAEMAERWLAVDSLAEEAMGVLMEALHCQGARSAALARYRDFREMLKREIGSPPGLALSGLASQLESASGSAPIPEEETVPQRYEADLVGREPQWQQMTQAFEAASAAGPEVLLLEGESGVGKTRLAEDFIHWTVARGATVLRGQGYQSAGEAPFGTIAAALRAALTAPGLAGADPEWLAEVARLVPELKRRFPGLPAGAGDAGGLERWRLFEGVAQLFLALAAERPTVLYFDDLQWCDAESCALVSFLLHRLGGAPMLFLATVTAGEMSRDLPAQQLVHDLMTENRCRSVAVPPLSEEEVWQLVRRLGNIRTPTGGRRFARRLFEVSDGNPFQVIEIAKMLFTEGLLAVTPVSREWVIPTEADAASFGRIEIPRSVSDALATRIARLPEELRDILASIAAAGRPVGTEVLSLIHGYSRLRVAALADALMERHLVTDEAGRYRMAHPLLAQYVRADLTTPRRVELHRALSQALEDTARPERLGEVAGEIASHAEQGQDAERACRFGLLAADHARERLGYEEALAWLELAARAVPAIRGEVNQRRAALARQAGWDELPEVDPTDGATPGAALNGSDIDLRMGAETV